MFQILNLAAAALAHVLVVSGGSVPSVEDCLRANSAPSGSAQTSMGTGADCRDDPLNLASLPAIQTTVRAFGITNIQIRMRGCVNAYFRTQQDNSIGSLHRFTVTYPIGATYVAETYLAPMTHEIAHIYQSEQAGSMQHLKETMTSERIELGADFLAGLIFHNYQSNSNLDEFQQNLALTGRYVEDTETGHGHPDWRVAAFREGYNFPYVNFNRDIDRANAKFQDDEYGIIVSY